MGDATATDCAAWVGAITGCVALGFEVWKYFREGPRIELWVARNMTAEELQPPANDVLLVTATNTGDADTTITHGYIQQSSDFLGLFRKKWLGGTWRSVVIGPRPRLLDYPAVVEPGKQWVGIIPEQLINESCGSWKYNYLCVKTATKKRPARVRIRGSAA